MNLLNDSRVVVRQPTYHVTVKQGWSSGGAPYKGEYEVTPTARGQSLPTEHRFLSQDITIHEIPYSETSTPGGGITISIAS